MITLLDKTYDGESIVDCHRDFSEAFDERFTPANASIPQDAQGFAEGEYRVRVTWGNAPLPDFTQEAKETALKVVPKGSAKVAFMLARAMYMAGAMRQFVQHNPGAQHSAEMLPYIMAATNLWMQCGNQAILQIFEESP